MPKKSPTVPEEGQLKLQFIVHTSQTGNATSSADLSAIRAHAKRDAHARARQRRMIEYQKSRASALPQLPRGETDTLGNRILWSPKPASILGAARTDPFDSLALSATPFEKFLLDHCKEESMIRLIDRDRERGTDIIGR